MANASESEIRAFKSTGCCVKTYLFFKSLLRVLGFLLLIILSPVLFILLSAVLPFLKIDEDEEPKIKISYCLK
jgi:hypothetical protein